MKNILLALSACAAALATALTVSAYPGLADTDTLQDRLAPIGQVCLKGDPCATPATVTVAAAPAASGGAAPAAADAGKSGEEVYNTKCSACHNSGAAGAPKIAVAADWEPRLAKGIETLYTNAIKGIGAMPAKGLCFDCTDQDIKNSVDYMLEKSK